jgi:two-component system chemotaxis response regulator CheB
MRIVLVDDSMLVRGMVKTMLESLGGYDVVGEAATGKKGIEVVRQLKPDLLLMDINMPEMDGITATGILMKESPLPIVILTSEDVGSIGYMALNNGAVEVVPKPDIYQMNDPEFLENLKNILDHAVRFSSFRFQSHPTSPSAVTPMGISAAKPGRKIRIVVIGASTGGPSAVRIVLSGLPADFPVPILISQHIEEGFDGGYAEWLDESVSLKVRLAKDYDNLNAGSVLIAPATRHLLCSESSVMLDDGPRVDNQIPSVNKMFSTASKAFGAGVLGVLLTGMGRDGSLGCLDIVKGGGITLIQDEESSMIYGMPKAAVELQAASVVLPLDSIAAEIIRRVG